MKSKIKIIVLETSGKRYVKEVNDDLKEYQQIVGGYIETIKVGNGLLLIVDEEGSLKDNMINVYASIKFDTIVFGNCFLVRTKGERFSSVLDYDMQTLLNLKAEELEWYEKYESVRKSGKYNMIMNADKAIKESGLTDFQYIYVIKHYDELNKQYNEQNEIDYARRCIENYLL